MPSGGGRGEGAEGAVTFKVVVLFSGSPLWP